jgi:hypothetical protein
MKLEECIQSAQPLFTDVVDLCKSTTDYIELENYLRQYITLEAITVGKPENFPDKKGCLIVIIKGDRASDVLYFDGVEYQSIRNGKTFKDLTRGFELTSQLWFRPNLR